VNTVMHTPEARPIKAGLCTYGARHFELSELTIASQACMYTWPMLHTPQNLSQALTCAPERCAPPDDVPAAAAPPAGASRSLSIDEVVLLRRMLPLLPASPACNHMAGTHIQSTPFSTNTSTGK
jgi:hypothetical protein